MDSVFVPENSYLDLLYSDIEPLHLYPFLDPKPSGDGEGDFTTDVEVDASNYEQLNNMDILSTMENGENGDGSYLCPSTTDAYAKIAELVEYVLKDQQEKQVEDVFAGNFILDEMAAENTEKFHDQKMQKCHKRTFLGSAESCPDASEPKYRRTVPAVSPGNGSLLALPLSSHPVNCTSLSNQHLAFSVPVIHGLERSFIIPGMYSPAIGVHRYI
ncbi:C2TA protein, partial [Pitta sordida]|nr:C2TA protein [Pitta sordida]